jgi:hypothetical protein
MTAKAQGLVALRMTTEVRVPTITEQMFFLNKRILIRAPLQQAQQE